MRKKLLRYESTHNRPNDPKPAEAGQQEWWIMSAKASLVSGEAAQPTADQAVSSDRQTFEVLNPRLDEQQIHQVTEQLGEILEAQL